MRMLFLVMLIVLIESCYSKEPVNTSLVGKELPQFNILGKDSTIFGTQLIPEGKPVVLFYFSPHCPYCRAQFEDITSNMDAFHNIQLYMLTPASYGEMKEFYKKYKIDQYPNITVGVDTAAYFSSYFNVRYVPATAIFNKKKKLDALFMGQIDARQIRDIARE